MMIGAGCRLSTSVSTLWPVSLVQEWLKRFAHGCVNPRPGFHRMMRANLGPLISTTPAEGKENDGDSIMRTRSSAIKRAYDTVMATWERNNTRNKWHP